MVRYLQASGPAMVGLKLSFQKDLIKIKTKTEIALHSSLLLSFRLSSLDLLSFRHERTTKLGFKIVKIQYGWVESDSNLVEL